MTRISRLAKTRFKSNPHKTNTPLPLPHPTPIYSVISPRSFGGSVGNNLVYSHPRRVAMAVDIHGFTFHQEPGEHLDCGDGPSSYYLEARKSCAGSMSSFVGLARQRNRLPGPSA